MHLLLVLLFQAAALGQLLMFQAAAVGILLLLQAAALGCFGVFQAAALGLLVVGRLGLRTSSVLLGCDLSQLGKRGAIGRRVLGLGRREVIFRRGVLALLIIVIHIQCCNSRCFALLDVVVVRFR